jgi:sugar lactone lactonase YvrE
MKFDDGSTGAQSSIYPDPAVHILDPRFIKYRLFNAGIEKLASGTRWGEGPVGFGDARCLLWSDIPNDRILRWDETTSAVSVFRHPSGNANGNARDRTGRLVTCEHSARRVTRTEYDGSITVIVDRFQGKRLNSPNDVVVASDGAIWFTDPPFGLGSEAPPLLTRRTGSVCLDCMVADAVLTNRSARSKFPLTAKRIGNFPRFCPFRVSR